MSALLVVHDVDDVDRWLKSPKREQLMGPRGFTVRTFVDRTDTTRVGLIVGGPTLEDFEELLKSDEAPEAMQHDGVHGDTIRVLVER